MLLRIFVAAALAVAAKSPFEGRWNFNLGQRASWLGIAEKDGALEVWYQPTGGNVYKVKDVSVQGAKLTLKLNSNTSWDLEPKGGELTGTQKRGDQTTLLTGARAPRLDRKAPKKWTAPRALFSGKDLTGWEPMGNPANSHWMVRDGVLTNSAKGANLRTAETFQDFKLHFEVMCPDHANSGFYLRGRYEIQLEYEPLSSNPPERRIGSVYGRIAPAGDIARRPGEWDTFDVTLVGRMLTVVRNGVTTIDRKEIEGITGGALDANEAEPGPFYIQGDHTGGLLFRNVTVATPAK
ncbi:MAG: DUF1080 domain-containing protein [Acidobacteria bacterium]|nr:DUF1080 domain-containing protein [Acidobacteriota bacterium]